MIVACVGFPGKSAIHLSNYGAMMAPRTPPVKAPNGHRASGGANRREEVRLAGSPPTGRPQIRVTQSVRGGRRSELKGLLPPDAPRRGEPPAQPRTRCPNPNRILEVFALEMYGNWRRLQGSRPVGSRDSCGSRALPTSATCRQTWRSIAALSDIASDRGAPSLRLRPGGRPAPNVDCRPRWGP